MAAHSLQRFNSISEGISFDQEKGAQGLENDVPIEDDNFEANLEMRGSTKVHLHLSLHRKSIQGFKFIETVIWQFFAPVIIFRVQFLDVGDSLKNLFTPPDIHYSYSYSHKRFSSLGKHCHQSEDLGR